MMDTPVAARKKNQIPFRKILTAIALALAVALLVMHLFGPSPWLRHDVLMRSYVSADETAGGMSFDRALRIAWREMGRPLVLDARSLRMTLRPEGNHWSFSWSNMDAVAVGEWYFHDSFSIDGKTGAISKITAADGIRQSK